MRLGIVGGALQGMEAAYLAKHAGMTSVVMDRRPDAPALSMADEKAVVDPVKDPEAARDILCRCDAVIPACENMDLLLALERILYRTGTPLLFDTESYRTSCSKEASNRMMGGLGVPLPLPWPECGFPAVVKPSSQSGSVGVSVVYSDEDVRRGLEAVGRLNDTPVIQEFVHGKSVSLEVIGTGRSVESYVTTEVVLDSGYYCKMVRCNPDVLGPEDDAAFREIGRRVAKAMRLQALMDVEAILTPKGLRVLEIDARIPSQTPAAVYAATGINLLDMLVGSALGRSLEAESSGGASVYEHFVINGNRISACGEKEFSNVRNPRVVSGIFGCDEMITDYEPGKENWYTTVITRGRTEAEVDSKRELIVSEIMETCGLDERMDPRPEAV
jgi:pyrrolysine biosynthesis protein PylC